VSQKVAVSVVFVAATFMAILDTTIVNTAEPAIGRSLHAAPDAIDSVVIGFLVSLAVFIPASGWLGDRLGGKRVLLAAVAGFTITSMLCGLASTLPELVLFRIAQGATGGLMAPVGMAMLYRAYPPQERMRAASVLVLGTALAPALGPVLGGVFVTHLSWRWIFFVNVPPGLVVLGFGLAFLRDVRQQRPGRFDARGFALAGGGLGLLMFGVGEGPARGWSSPAVLATLAAGGLLLLLLVMVELSADQPMLDLRLYRDRLFRASGLALALTSVGFYGLLYLLALFYQDVLGLSALQSGLNTFPEAVGVMIGAQLVGRVLYPRLGPRGVMSGSALLVAALTALFALVDAGTGLWAVRGVMVLLGAAMSGVFVPAQTAAFATVDPARMGRASALFNAQRQFGAAAGVALLSTVSTSLRHGRRADDLAAALHAYHVAFLTAAATILIAAGWALTVSDRDAAETMTRRGGKPGPQFSDPRPAALDIGCPQGKHNCC
jgi:EmrB/QacA subfamily drug resistance transporter